MNFKISLQKFSQLKYLLDWELLLFLILFLNVKLALKVLAIIFIYLSRSNFKFGFSLKNSRLPLFYLLVIGIAIIDLFIAKNYSAPNYLPVFITGVVFWALCILAIHQVKLSVEHVSPETINRTIVVFFLINALISLINLGAIIWETGAINPYTYQGQHQKYFIGTGDYIKGITFDTSTTNAVLNAFGVIYFLVKKNAAMLLVCMAVMLFTCSNYVNIVLTFILIGLFIFKSDRLQKSLIAACFVFLVIFMAKISPQNNDYVITTINNILHVPNPPKLVQNSVIARITDRPDSVLSPEEKKQKIATLSLDSLSLAISKRRPQKKASLAPTNIPLLRTDAGRILVPGADINSEPYQSLATTPAEQMQLLGFINTHKASLPISAQPYHWSATPGKLTGMLQTGLFFINHPQKVLTGDGPGNFSSKLAFRACGLGFSGGFPAKFIYINRDFLVNHLDLYLNYFSKRAGFHSLTNSPFSVYDQLIAEYGFFGLLFFFIFYIGFFLKHRRVLNYGLPALLLALAILFTDYWFEQLSVLVFFELLLFLDIKENFVLQHNQYGNELS